MNDNTLPEMFEFSQTLDVNTLTDLYCGDTMHSEMVFSEFMNLTPEFLTDMNKLFEINDVPALKKMVHKFKPMLYYVGLTSLHENMQQFENKCNGTENTISLEPEFSIIKNELLTGILLVKNELQRLQAYNGNTPK